MFSCRDKYDMSLNYSKNKEFAFFTFEDVTQKLMPVKINSVMETFGMNNDETISVMRYFHWNVEKM